MRAIPIVTLLVVATIDAGSAQSENIFTREPSSLCLDYQIPLPRYSQLIHNNEVLSASSQASATTSPPKQESPALNTFGIQILRNFRGLVSTKNILPAAIGAGATAISSAFDDDVKDYFAETPRIKTLGNIGQVVGNPGVLGGFSGAMLLWSYKTENQHFRSMSYSLAQGLIVNYGMTMGLKLAVRRTRPALENNHSFPSGHSSGMFVTATVISHYYPRASIPLYISAGLVGVSRLEKNEHWLSDVVAGAALGYVVARTVVRGTDSLKIGGATIRPVLAPGGGIAVAVAIPVPLD